LSRTLTARFAKIDDMRLAAAIGFRVHSGWAASVVIAGPTAKPVVLRRERIVLSDPSLHGSVQPYHAAEYRELSQASRLIEQCRDSSRQLADQAFSRLADDVGNTQHHLAGCGILLGSGRLPDTLEAVLRSHAYIHTAEGELFRDVLRWAADRRGIPLTLVKERDAMIAASKKLRLAGQELQTRIQELGRPLGPPWRQDEKLAALIAWLSLLGAAA